MEKANPPGMEQKRGSIRAPARCAGVGWQQRAVHAFAFDGCAEPGEVRTDLMKPARFDRACDQCTAIRLGNHTPVRHGGHAAAPRNADLQITTADLFEGFPTGAMRPRQPPAHDGEIGLGHGTRLELRTQRVVGRGTARQKHHARCLAVESVQQPPVAICAEGGESASIDRECAVQERVIRMSEPGQGDRPRGFLDREQRVIPQQHHAWNGGVGRWGVFHA